MSDDNTMIYMPQRILADIKDERDDIQINGKPSVSGCVFGKCLNNNGGAGSVIAFYLSADEGYKESYNMKRHGRGGYRDILYSANRFFLKEHKDIELIPTIIDYGRSSNELTGDEINQFTDMHNYVGNSYRNIILIAKGMPVMFRAYRSGCKEIFREEREKENQEHLWDFMDKADLKIKRFWYKLRKEAQDRGKELEAELLGYYSSPETIPERN